MKYLSIIIIAILITPFYQACNAQLKNATSDTVRIYGNCGMCETTIEKEGSLKNVSEVTWNKDTKMAIASYDTTKTNLSEILKRIALKGYDSDEFLAPDNVYSQLPECCKYERAKKPEVKTNVEEVITADPVHTEMQIHETVPVKEISQEPNQLQVVFNNYFELKDALVQSDGNTTSAKAKDLLTLINAVKMEELSMDEHMVWMKVMKELATDAQSMSETTDIDKQRISFITLSQNMYDLMKGSKSETPTYYQFCPMANDGKGANWLSKETAIKNPYYGSAMLTCGKTVETIE